MPSICSYKYSSLSCIAISSGKFDFTLLPLEPRRAEGSERCME